MSWHRNGARCTAKSGNSARVDTAPVSPTTPRDGSTKIPAWGSALPPPSPRPNYVTVGSVRYAVRFATPQQIATRARREQLLLPGGGSGNQADCCGCARVVLPSGAPANHVDCCCGAVQLQWRERTPPPPPASRIPLPSPGPSQASTAKQQPAIIRRGLFGRINSGERGGASAEPGCAATGRGVRSCFRPQGDDDERGGGVRSMQTDPAPPQRRVLVRAKPDVPAHLRLCAPDDAAAAAAAAPEQRRNTLDRFHRRLFGERRRKERTGDQSGRLRELTERLKGAPPPPPPPAAAAQPSASSPPPPPPEAAPAAAPADDEKEDDIFECVDLKLPKPESRTIVGSYIQRTIPFRSASFSQVDFNPADGKYIRSSPRCGTYTAVPACPASAIAGGSLTLPRKKLPDSKPVTPPASSPPPQPQEAEELPAESPPPAEEPGPPAPAHKPSGSRSLTYPLPRRGSRPDDDIPFSSIDGNGLKSLSHPAGRELQEVAEECETCPRSDEEGVQQSPGCAEGADPGEEQPPPETPDAGVDDEPSGAGTPEKADIEIESRRKVIHLAPSDADAPREVFVTEWPRPEDRETDIGAGDDARSSGDSSSRPHSGSVSKQSSLEGDKAALPWHRQESSQDSDSPKRWSGEGDRTSSEWSGAAPRPRLVCQSSEEKDDEAGRRCIAPPPPAARADSLSEGESDQGERRPATPSTSLPLSPSDVSDSEGRAGRRQAAPRRYSKRPLRGPYGQMLEAEMKKPEASRTFSKLQYNEELKFLEEYSPTGAPAAPAQSADDPRAEAPTPLPRAAPKRKVSAPHSAPVLALGRGGAFVCHTRTTSSPSKLEGHSGPPRPGPELLAELLRGSSERVAAPAPALDSAAQHWKDTRTHVVVELFDTERSYVESLQILVTKYLQPLKSPENAGLVDAVLVDEIFFQIPAILAHHEVFLEELRGRLERWDSQQTVGDIFLEAFTKQPLLETYTAFINNWMTAKETIKATCQAKPAFARFLDAMAREHKGRLALDHLLIMPVQRIPRYELLMQRLLKHTERVHPDHQLLLAALRGVHELAVRINCTERAGLEQEQQLQTLRELEALVEGLAGLASPERCFLRHDPVAVATAHGRKDRVLFLFSDLLVVASIKRRSGTMRKPSTNSPGTVTSALEANKYKLLMRIPLEDLEVMRAKDENLRRMLSEMACLTEDVAALAKVADLVGALHCPHAQLEELVRDTLAALARQLADRQSSDSQLAYMELTVGTQNGIENISVVFTKPEKRTSWEETFNEAKQKLALSADRRPSPEFVAPLPIRKTRAGLQFTCAAPTLGLNARNLRDVWVCNSDGYVGQVCVLSLQPEPTVVSCNGVCNARILCIASIPVCDPRSSAYLSPGQVPVANSKACVSISVEDTDKTAGNIQLDSSSSSSESEDDDRESLAADDEQKRARGASDPPAGERGGGEPPPPGGAGDDAGDSALQPTMWLGTEDGCIHVYNCSDNIRIKKNKVKIQHGSSVHCIIYLDNRVFVSLANGDITVYVRDNAGGWNTADPYTVSVGTVAAPVNRMLPIAGKLWCGCHNSVKILNTASLQVEHSFQVGTDGARPVTCMAASGLGVWVSLQNSAVLKLLHATSYEPLCDVNVAPAVTKMLASCDDIIRQHKAACLRVTSLLACKDLLWVGTSAGVVLTVPLPHVSPSTSKLLNVPTPSGVPHGHTGHVRFLTFVETMPAPPAEALAARPASHHRHSLKAKPELQGGAAGQKLLVISGGDGYEDFRTSSASEVAGREDSTNHLLLWHV